MGLSLPFMREVGLRVEGLRINENEGALAMRLGPLSVGG
eukprot:gene25984-31377_t